MATLKGVSGSTLVSKAPAPDLNNALITAFGTPKSRAADREAKAEAKRQRARDAQQAADIATITGTTPPFVPATKEEPSSIFDTFTNIFGDKKDEASTPATSTISRSPATPKEIQNAKLRLSLGGGKEMLEVFESIENANDERQKEIATEQVNRATLQSDFILNSGKTPEEMNEAIRFVIADNQLNNLPTEQLEKALNSTYEQQITFFEFKRSQGKDLETLFSEPPKAQTDIGKLQQDLDNDFITQEQYDKLFTAQMLENEAGGGVKDLAPEILATFPASVRAAANAVYVSSGGGDDGIKAVKNYTDQLQDVSKASNLPETLSIIFPNASPDDFAALENVVRSAASIDEGMKLAAKLRETQVKEEKIEQSSY